MSESHHQKVDSIRCYPQSCSVVLDELDKRKEVKVNSYKIAPTLYAL